MELTKSSFSNKQMLCEEAACTGCAACAAACSQNCLTLFSDSEGFLRPNIDSSRCTGCNCCIRVCPILHFQQLDLQRCGNSIGISSYKFVSYNDDEQQTPTVYAAWHLDDDIRYKSSSGGVFTALAEHILSEGGVVAGAAFDNLLLVRHILIDNLSELYRLRGSKYVQSEVTPVILRQIYDLLEQGRQVLFSGTPCEVAGLHSYLNHPYDNLFSCDLICHGVPSPLLLERYVKYSLLKGDQVVGISFRDKTKGWKKSQVRKYLQNSKSKLIRVRKDPYMSAFLKDYALRPSCYECRFKMTQRVSDLTIADFWGVSKTYPQYDLDDKGTSLVLVNNKKGKAWLNLSSSKLFLGHADIDTAISGNPSLVRSSLYPSQRKTFYCDLKIMPFSKVIIKYRITTTAFAQARSAFKRIVKAGLRKITQPVFK
jgi:coenzyme F420-reducing hydrogenase beta subunit